MNRHKNIFIKHSNFGLVKQCLQSLQRQNIRQLTKIYLTLPLSEISKQVNPALSSTEIEDLVLNMIHEGDIFASISHADGGMVIFRDSPERYDDQTTMETLDLKIKRSIIASEGVTQMDRIVSSSREFITKQMHGSSGMTGTSGGLDDEAFGENFDPRIMSV